MVYFGNSLSVSKTKHKQVLPKYLRKYCSQFGYNKIFQGNLSTEYLYRAVAFNL